MPALKKDNGLLVTETAFPLLISPNGFIGTPGEAGQRKGEFGQEITEKRCFPEAGLCQSGANPIQMQKPLQSHRARHANEINRTTEIHNSQLLLDKQRV